MSLYSNLFEAFKKCHGASLSKASIQEKCNSTWKQLKQDFPESSALQTAVHAKVQELHERGNRSSATLRHFFAEAATKKPTEGSASTSKSANDTVDKESESSNSNRPEGGEDPTIDPDDPDPPVPAPESHDILKRKFDTPAQDAARAKVAALESKLTAQFMSRDLQLDDPATINKEIGNTNKELKKSQKVLSRMENNAKYQRKHREKQKQLLAQASTAPPRTQPGRPRVEDSQPGLLQAIIDIAVHGSAAHDRRRTDEIRSCKTLTELQTQLNNQGYTISRTATYVRLLPHRSGSTEGKRHVKTVPVRLSRPTNSLHKGHPDSKFCTATIRFLECLASLLGPQQVAFTSQDDKARVPLGITAAKEQGQILMHVEYMLQLPDHDFVVGEKHKLIPSVYAGIVIEANGQGKPEAVSYSGPTYIGIRSGKHASSTAASHAYDFSTSLRLESFDKIMKGPNGDVKPILMVTVDGGPDENPRYPKTISFAIEHFKACNLDALFIAANAPHRSAFNRVERRMAPLSRQLTGVILPHDTFGSHLDSSGKTVDTDLELKNFEAAGKVLAEVWSELVIDSHDVTAEYLPPDAVAAQPESVSPEWYAKHVRESQYFLQIVKCLDTSCCTPLRSDLRLVLSEGFLPPPVRYVQDAETGKLRAIGALEDVPGSHFMPLFQRITLKVPITLDLTDENMPYDHYCPSIQGDLSRRQCQTCFLYFASFRAVESHSRALHPTGRQLAAIRRRRAEQADSAVVGGAPIAPVLHAEMSAVQHSEPGRSAAAPLRRSSRLAARITERDGEVLCRTMDAATGAEDVEWVQADDLDVQNLPVVLLDVEHERMPTVSVDAALTIPWADAD